MGCLGMTNHPANVKDCMYKRSLVIYLLETFLVLNVTLTLTYLPDELMTSISIGVARPYQHCIMYFCIL